MTAPQLILLGAGIAGVFGAVAGLALLLLPRRIFEQPSRVRRLLFETNIGDVFNRRFAIERRVYRRHRYFGVLVLAGALAGASLVWIATQRPVAAAWLTKALGPLGYRVVLVFGAAIVVLLVVAGLCLLIRPSVLKGIEAAANRWIDPIPRQGSHAWISNMVIRAPRLAGTLLLVTGIACVRPF